MEIKTLIEYSINSTSSEAYSSLWKVVKKIVEDCTHHLSQITAQMANYDIHDEKHSSKVLENIENLLGDRANQLSFYELILIYASCFLHDAAMALPKWEYDMLRAVEGCNECFDNTIKYPIQNDFKPVQPLSVLKSFINENKESIYVNFEKVSDFIFSPNNEEQFQIDLAKRVHDYEEFRNEFADQLEMRKKNPCEYLDFSSLIRSEFIRKTHHIRIVDFIKNMRQDISIELGETAAVKILDDLSNVCRAHGESIEFVEKMSIESSVNQIGSANLQFVSILLRLGDIIHFSSDRAPLSLFAEKRITDSNSIAHWNAKFSETHYDIVDENGKMTIRFYAYCSEPSVYYFLHEYLDWIDDEVGYYFSFYHNLEFLKISKRENYDLRLNSKVDRTHVIADETKFIPDHTAKFTMDQSQILSLLMGEQLYKDKYLCLRELYQNSLDASKCMKAQDENIGISSLYNIVFGLKTDYQGRKYIYCLDSGIGMTREIVKRYFLRIGNSYYKSREFISSNVNWLNKVNPTSQFGIGVLSCFMVGKTIEVTTKHFSSQSDPFSFCLDAYNERFYYIPVNSLDDELIGAHGTLIKIILSEEEAERIHNHIPEDYIYLLYSGSSESYFSSSGQNSYEDFKNSLFYKINSQIAITYPGINVLIDTGEERLPIIPRNEIFNYREADVDIDRVASIWSKYHFTGGRENPYKETIECRNYIKNIPVHVSESGVELDTFVSLPLKGIPNTNKYIFSFEKYVWATHSLQILVDGIVVSESWIHNNYTEPFGINLSQSGKMILNFTGKVRPSLSIDRNSIVRCPDESIEMCERIVTKLLQEVVSKLINHLEHENLDVNSDEAQLALNIVLTEYCDFSSELLELIGNSKFGDIQLRELNKYIRSKSGTINAIIADRELVLDFIDFRALSPIVFELLIGKMLFATDIELDDDTVTIISNRFSAPSALIKAEYRGPREYHYVIKADKWTGVYASYDIVSSMWPLVPERIFKKIKSLHESDCVESVEHFRIISNAGNGLYGIASLEPAMINPKFGISSHYDNGFGKPECLIGRCEKIENQYWLFELNDHGKLRNEEKKDYALFAYIAPRKLSEDDEVRLKDFIGKDDVYVKGVREGWSILFLGYDQKYYILPGLCEKSSLIELISPSIRNRENGITYYNLDDTTLF